MILENLRKLLLAGENVFVRIPVIVGVNDTGEEMLGIRSFFESCKMPNRIELLPYHTMGEHKYAALGKNVQRFEIPSEDTIKRCYSYLNVNR